MASLVKSIDNLVAQYAGNNLASVVAFVGSDADALRRNVATFENTYGFKNVVLAIPKDHEAGHRRLELDPNAAVTVMIYRNKKIVVNSAATSDGLTSEYVQKVASDTSNVLR